MRRDQRRRDWLFLDDALMSSWDLVLRGPYEIGFGS